MDIDTAFEILGFPDKYTVKTMGEVNKKYRNLVLQYHPDKTGNDEKMTEIFKQIANAYQAITDDPPPYDRPASAAYAAPRYTPGNSYPGNAAHRNTPGNAFPGNAYSGTDYGRRAREEKAKADEKAAKEAAEYDALTPAQKAEKAEVLRIQKEENARRELYEKNIAAATAEAAEVLKQGSQKTGYNPLFSGISKKPSSERKFAYGLKHKSSRKKNTKKRKQTKKRKGKK